MAAVPENGFLIRTIRTGWENPHVMASLNASFGV
jgi:hypothetical protein